MVQTVQNRCDYFISINEVYFGIIVMFLIEEMSMMLKLSLQLQKKDDRHSTFYIFVSYIVEYKVLSA